MTGQPSLVAVLAGLVACGAASPAPAKTPVLVDCRLPDLEAPARCGELQVPENPERPDGRQITISYAVVPATGDKSLRDPIVPLYGGPGEQVIGEAGYVAKVFAALRERRDILLVDQRGAGRSSALRCRFFDPAAPAQSLVDMVPPKAVETCARELGADRDLTQYSYLNFAHDLEAVRLALGYSQLNLHAGSYGTRAAQVFMRMYPASVRTALLSGSVPIGSIAPLTMARSAQEAFEDTFDACAADAECRVAYPDLRADFDAMLAELDAGAVRASIPGATAATLGRGRAVEWLRAKLYRPRNGAEVPWLVHRARKGEWSPFFEGILAQARELDTAYSLGLWLAITCSEDIAYMREEDIAPATTGTYLGDYRVRQQQRACRAWPKARLPANYREPLRTGIPTMFVSGDMDAATPLHFTASMAPGFRNRVEVVMRGQGHTEWNDCVGVLFRRFVETGAADGIEPACPAMPRPPFRI